MAVGILKLAAQIPKFAKRFKISTSDGGNTSMYDTDRTIFSDKELYKTKMRGQINSTAPGGSSAKYNPNFVGPRKGVESILSQNYTGAKQSQRSIGEKSTGLNPMMTARLHTAQDVVRPNEDIIKSVNKVLVDDNFIDAGKQFNVYKRGAGTFANTDHVKDYVERGMDRHGSVYRNPGLVVHPDFIVPPELQYMVDFNKKFAKYDNSPFSQNVPGILSNYIRNNSYHKHYENNLYRYLTEKKIINKAYKDGLISKKQKDADLKKADKFISKIKTDMANLGLETKVYNKKKMGFDTYGKRYEGPYSGLYKDQMKNYKLELPPASAKGADVRQHIEDTYKMIPGLKPDGHKDGGLIDTNLDDTSTTVDDLPLLDPQESIDRLHKAGGGAFKIVKELAKVPKAVGSYFKAKGTPTSATDIAVGQAVEDKPAMYLSTVNAIEDMPDTVKMNANQWLGTIKNKPGVSGTELDEFGLEALLTNVSKGDAKRQLTKPELLEMYNKEMPQIDMDVSIAEPVSRGADDIVQMLTRMREKRGNQYDYGNRPDIFSNDARLLTDLHQPPQDVTGMKLREMLLNNMKNLQVNNEAADPINSSTIKFLNNRGDRVEMHRGEKFNEMWEGGFPSMFHGTNDIVKKEHLNVLKNLVPQEDIAQLAKAKNIPEEKAFQELYQALNIFDRNVMTADVPIPFWTKKLLYRMGDMSEGRGFFYKSKKSPAHEGAQFIPGGSGYGELKFYFNFKDGSVRSAEKEYRSGHFSGEVFEGNAGNSPFGWLRFSERIDENGRKLLLVEETQSDLHQNVAQKGYKYAPRLDKGNVMATMSDFAAQLDKKMQTLESTRLRKDQLLQLPRSDRELPENVAELKNLEKAIKKLATDVNKLNTKVAEQNQITGKSGSVHPDAPFKKSENYAKVFMQGLMKMADDKGYDGIGLSTGKMKKEYGGIPKGGDKFYDEIGVKAMKRIAKKSGFKFGDTTIVDGKGFTWEKIPIISMRDINTGKKFAGESTIPVYSRGGQVKKEKGYNGY